MLAELPLKLSSPAYSAVIVWVPPPRALNVSAADPFEIGCGWASFRTSDLNWTEPDGVPAPGGTTAGVAVKVTGCPNCEGLPDVVSPRSVSALDTTYSRAPDVLAL